jgi:hypothetical protein
MYYFNRILETWKCWTDVGTSDVILWHIDVGTYIIFPVDLIAGITCLTWVVPIIHEWKLFSVTVFTGAVE